MSKLKNLARQNEIRIDDHGGHKSSPKYFYQHLRNAYSFYFRTFITQNESYDFYVSTTATNVRKHIKILESQHLDEENTTYCLISFEVFFELYLKDLLSQVNLKLTYTEDRQNKSGTTWNLIEKIRLKTFVPSNPDRKGIHKIPFRQTIGRLYDLFQYSKDQQKSQHPIVKKFIKVTKDVKFLDDPAFRETFEFLNWYRDRILHNGNKLPRLRFLDFLICHKITPIVDQVIKSPEIPEGWLFFTKTISGLEILQELMNTKFEVRNTKTKKQINNTYRSLLYIGHLKEMGRANLNMNHLIRRDQATYEYNYKEPKQRGMRFAQSEKKNHRHAFEVKECPCCQIRSLVHYLIPGSELPIPQNHNIEWLKCYTCEYHIRYNVYDLSYFNDRFERHFRF